MKRSLLLLDAPIVIKPAQLGEPKTPGYIAGTCVPLCGLLSACLFQ